MPARALERQLDAVAVEHAGPAVAEADELVAVGVDALADDAADDRVEAGAVAAAGQHADAHGAMLSCRPAERQRLEAVDPVDAAVLGLAVEREPGHARREEARAPPAARRGRGSRPGSSGCRRRTSAARAVAAGA